MDPIWAAIAEFWWIAPAAVGAGGVGWLGVRHQRAENARRLELEAARADLRESRRAITTSRATVKVARAELSRLQAERAAGRASAAEVASARTHYENAQRDARAASAAARSHRAQISAARAAMSAAAENPDALPLPRLIARHEAVDARWMAYETDPARLIAFPTMSDGREPLTAAFLAASAEARRLRPSTDAKKKSRVTPAQYSAYRDAVREMERAFDVAEHEAWRRARAAGTVPADLPDQTIAQGPTWSALAQTFAQDMIDRSGEFIARVADTAKTWKDAGAPPRPDPRPDPRTDPRRDPRPDPRPKPPEDRGPHR